MSPFEDFLQLYGPPEDCVVPDDEVLRAYEGRIPPELFASWRESGWCSYGRGLLWTVDPRTFDDIIDDWVEVDSDRPVVFLRSAFAHLYLWHEGHILSLDVQTGSLSQVTKDIRRMFTFLCMPELREKILRVSLFEEARRTLGALTRDHCYAFEPALVLGGPGTLDTIKRVAMREHLGLLAQVVLG